MYWCKVEMLKEYEKAGGVYEMMMDAVVEDDKETKGAKAESRTCQRLYRPVSTWTILLSKHISCLKGGI